MTDNGLPRMKDNSRPQDAWTLLVCGGIERLTQSLLRGDAFSERALQDMLKMDRRLNAFHNALNDRLKFTEKGQ